MLTNASQRWTKMAIWRMELRLRWTNSIWLWSRSQWKKSRAARPNPCWKEENGIILLVLDVERYLPAAWHHYSTARSGRVVHNKFANVAFICDGRLEQVRVQGGHGWEEVSLRRWIRDWEEEDEKWRQREKCLGLTIGSLFNSSGNKVTCNDPPRCA
jgi:hypothetical protein